MRVVIQRVKEASVTIGGEMDSSIGEGLMVLVGIEEADGDEDIEWLCRKIVNMRLFNDDDGVMNLPVTSLDNGGILVVSQFTLMASTKKGNRPSYIRAARPEISIPLYERFVSLLSQIYGKTVQTGRFGADMKVHLTNDGPFTIMLDEHILPTG